MAAQSLLEPLRHRQMLLGVMHHGVEAGGIPEVVALQLTLGAFLHNQHALQLLLHLVVGEAADTAPEAELAGAEGLLAAVALPVAAATTTVGGLLLQSLVCSDHLMQKRPQARSQLQDAAHCLSLTRQAWLMQQ